MYTVIKYSVLTDVDCAIAGAPERKAALANTENRKHDTQVIASSFLVWWLTSPLPRPGLLRTGRFVGPVKLYSLLPHGHYFVLRP